jgi:hypothetical protein
MSCHTGVSWKNSFPSKQTGLEIKLILGYFKLKKFNSVYFHSVVLMKPKQLVLVLLIEHKTVENYGKNNRSGIKLSIPGYLSCLCLPIIPFLHAFLTHPFFTFPFPHFTLSLHCMLPPPPHWGLPARPLSKGARFAICVQGRVHMGEYVERDYCKSGRFVTVRTCGRDRWSLRNRHRQRMEIVALKIYGHESVYICLLYQCA